MKDLKINATAYHAARNDMEKLLHTATIGGGFDSLTATQLKNLDKAGKIVKAYEDINYPMPIPVSVPEILEQVMYKRRLKQKGMARLLGMTEPKLSVVMKGKQKPTLTQIKVMHQKLGIDGNLLLKVV